MGLENVKDSLIAFSKFKIGQNVLKCIYPVIAIPDRVGPEYHGFELVVFAEIDHKEWIFVVVRCCELLDLVFIDLIHDLEVVLLEAWSKTLNKDDFVAKIQRALK